MRLSLFLILKAAYDILKEMYNHLLGVRADDNLVREIKETIAQHPNVGGVYDLVLIVMVLVKQLDLFILQCQIR